ADGEGGGGRRRHGQRRAVRDRGDCRRPGSAAMGVGRRNGERVGGAVGEAVDLVGGGDADLLGRATDGRGRADLDLVTGRVALGGLPVDDDDAVASGDGYPGYPTEDLAGDE